MDYDKILIDKEQPSYLKDLVRKLKDKGHVSVGNWLQMTSTTDLISAMNSCKELRSPLPETVKVGALPPSVAGAFVSLLNLLSTGEGLDITVGIEAFIVRAKYLESYIASELLTRRGFDIKIQYTKLTLTEEDIGKGPQSEVLEIGPAFKDQMGGVLTRILDKVYPDLKEPPLQGYPPVSKPVFKTESEPIQKEPLNKESVVEKFKSWMADFKNYKKDGS